MAVPIQAALTLSTGLFTAGISTAGAGLRAFTGLVKAATIAIAGLAAGLALVTRNQIQFVDRLGKISDTVGLTTDLIQKFGFAAEIAGVLIAEPLGNQLHAQVRVFQQPAGLLAAYLIQ